MNASRGRGLPIRAWLGLGVVVALLVYVIATGFSSATQYYLTVGQFDAARGAYVGRTARVQGSLVTSTVRFDRATHALSFDLRGEGRLLPVVYRNGDVPYDFGKAENAIVVGSLTPSGVFEAQQVLVQCPSHYRAPTSLAAQGS